MNGAEDMIVDHDVIVPQVFRSLGKRLDRPCIAAEFDLRVNHTSFHRTLPLWCETVISDPTSRDRSESSSPKAAIGLAATRCRLADGMKIGRASCRERV